MAGLPHWDNSIAARNYYEPVFKNQFEVIITPPAAITQDVDILVEQVISISGLPEFFTAGTTKQKYKFAERAFAKATPETTLANLKVNFEVNLNESNSMYVYNTLRGWSDVIYDPATGRQGLKKDYVGEIYVAIFNKAGDIFRDFKFKPAFISKAFNAMDLNYTEDGIHQMTVEFVADTTKETRVGQINI